MLKIRTDTKYVTPDGKLNQAGYEAIQGQIDSQSTASTALTARVATLEGHQQAVLLATKTASASATVDFTEFNNALYDEYRFELDNVKPATDGTGLWCRVSTDGGSTYDDGAGAYSWAYASSVGDAASGADTFLALGPAQGNAAAERGVTGSFTLRNAPSSAQHTRMFGAGSGYSTAGIVQAFTAAGARLADQDTTALRFLMSSGNITSGTIRMYGLT